MKFFYTSLPWKPKGSNNNFLKNDLYRRANYGKDISTTEKERNTIKYLCGLKLDSTSNKICSGSKDTTVYKLNGSTNDFFINIRDQKIKLLSQGLITYRDSYNIASEYIEICKEIKLVLRKRFKYIFIDEAQDLEKYQLDIIESIFNIDESKCIIQRIGDINQSIYNSGKSIKVECDWVPRNPLHLNSSLRLTKEIADIVNCFTLKKEFKHIGNDSHEFKVIGEGVIERIIRPYLIIFNSDTVGGLKPKFEELIRQHNLFDGVDGRNTQKGYKIIGWSGTWKDEDNNGRLRLENIFPNEYKMAHASKKDKVNLCEYLIYNPKYNTLKRYSEDIIEALCTILRIAKCTGQEIQRHYTSQTLWKYLVGESRKTEGMLSEQDLLDFKSQLYTWSFSIATNNQIEDTYNEVKSFVAAKLSGWCGFSVDNEVRAFLGTNFENAMPNEAIPSVDLSSNIPIEICSVHAVKGQTHCATMYVETSYYQYETQKLAVSSKKATTKRTAEFYNNPLLQQTHNYENGSCYRAKEAMKMMYVGFSRPTHLLCFAVLKNNLTDNYLSFFAKNDNGWTVVDLTENAILT